MKKSSPMTRVAVVTLGALLIAGCADVLEPVAGQRDRPVPNYDNAASDLEAPVLTAFDFAPKAINTTAGPASTTVDLTATDDVSGVGSLRVDFLSPSGTAFQSGFDDGSAATSFSGSLVVTFPRFSEAGTWTVWRVFIFDAVGHLRQLGTADLVAAGFPTTLMVQNTIPVPIDIIPGSSTNPINLKKKGLVPVAILSAADFDALTLVVRSSLTFGRMGDEGSWSHCQNEPQDVDGNGYNDLVCYFRMQDTGFRVGDTMGILLGELTSGQPIEGTDAVRVR